MLGRLAGACAAWSSIACAVATCGFWHLQGGLRTRTPDSGVVFFSRARMVTIRCPPTRCDGQNGGRPEAPGWRNRERQTLNSRHGRCSGSSCPGVLRRSQYPRPGHCPAGSAAGGELPAVEYVECALEPVVIATMDAGGIDLAILDGEAVPASGMGICRQLRTRSSTARLCCSSWVGRRMPGWLRGPGPMTWPLPSTPRGSPSQWRRCCVVVLRRFPSN